jgi:hypothetical protein
MPFGVSILYKKNEPFFHKNFIYPKNFLTKTIPAAAATNPLTLLVATYDKADSSCLPTTSTSPHPHCTRRKGRVGSTKPHAQHEFGPRRQSLQLGKGSLTIAIGNQILHCSWRWWFWWCIPYRTCGDSSSQQKGSTHVNASRMPSGKFAQSIRVRRNPFGGNAAGLISRERSKERTNAYYYV